MFGTRLSDLNPMHFYRLQVLETILVRLCFLTLDRQNSKSTIGLTLFWLWDARQDRGPVT